MPLTSEQIISYGQDGYIIVPGLLSEEEIDRFVEYEHEPKPAGWKQNLRHHVDDESWRYLATKPNVAGAVSQLIGGSPRVVQTMYMEKHPSGDADVGGQGVALHQDYHYLPCEPDTLIACW
ncbi:MAG: phytanoyl-CoA dioxygenase family protein, partial [Rhodothermia bacterium]